MQPYVFGPDLRSRFQANLGRFTARNVERAGLRDAAVAIVVIRHNETGEACVLMTLRPPSLNRHGGQYALPGGRMDAGESEVEAALRELHEELGLDLRQDDVLGRLDQFPTRSGFRVSPVVVWASGDVELRPDPSEVAQVFHLPLREFDSPDIPRLEESDNSEHPVLSAFFPTLGHYMYAPTAAILYQFREIALRGKTTRVSHFDQPTFAWK
ncbi:ADP-ribose pyrophosphatase YjhB, NUDIX family [Ruegeria marina]|uniref:ADP-ribose pyrophosphatase YjhB, NUDIX family n=1 Tax=Ruegeria marina TaxID=639004 RepID=A0A1G7AIF1_9RHOB|nr:ADP-ribose pyrophosphatase YjhB, NUDIX family [Ruegeria marina]